MSDIKNTCDRCGYKCGWFNLNDLRDIYRVGGIVNLCNRCGDRANSFVDYYGKKKEKDKKDLSDFLMSGELVKKRFDEINNAGYVND